MMTLSKKPHVKLKKAVSDYYGIAEIDIFGTSRKHNIVLARQMYYYLVSKHQEYSTYTPHDLARLLKIDHTLLKYYAQRVEDQKIYPDVKAALAHFKSLGYDC